MCCGPRLAAARKSSTGHELGGVGSQGAQRVGLVHVLRLMVYGGECLTQERWRLCVVWVRDSAQGAWLLFVESSVQSHTILGSPSHHWSPEWVAGCEQDFMHWLFTRAPGCLADPSLFLADWIPADFHSYMYMSSSSGSGALGASGLGLRLLTPQGELYSWDIRILTWMWG